MRKKTVLIIDDETEFADMVQMRLEANNFEVITAPNGADGYELAQTAKPNLILLDVMMPVMDGFETLRKLRRSVVTQATPIIMLTARGESASIFKAQGLNVTDYLTKPFDSTELVATVKRYA